jgi:hypothetical protein
MQRVLRSFAALGLLLAALGASACGPRHQVIVVNGIQVYDNRWRQVIDQLGPRASFELGCPGPQLQFILLRMQGRAPVEVGVQGCGHSAVYLRLLMTDQWVMNSRSEIGSGQESVAPVPAPTAPPQPL